MLRYIKSYFFLGFFFFCLFGFSEYCGKVQSGEHIHIPRRLYFFYSILRNTSESLKKLSYMRVRQIKKSKII